MAPIDLLAMLDAPFASLASLQVPALTNALVRVCGEVLAFYANLMRAFIQAVGDAVLGGGLSGDVAAGAAAGIALPNCPMPDATFFKLFSSDTIWLCGQQPPNVLP